MGKSELLSAHRLDGAKKPRTHARTCARREGAARRKRVREREREREIEIEIEIEIERERERLRMGMRVRTGMIMRMGKPFEKPMFLFSIMF